MRKLGALLAVLWLSGSGPASGMGSSDRGTSSAELLKLGVGARAVAMGEAFSAAADDATALYWNAAGLTRVSAQSATFMHAPYVDGSFFNYAVYGRKLGDLGLSQRLSLSLNL